jgi:inosine-uridine nucleoside N-ribohydrolase
VDAKLSGNMDTFGKGVRGRPVHVVYDLQRCRFQEWGPWNEYGVGLHQDVGVVSEDRAAFWMAEWPRSVAANLIRLSGAYPNQPQRKTAWKIEIRRNGKWHVHDRGVGGWYHGGRYVWGGPGTALITLDAFRVSVFSKDARTRLRSIHFRGEDRFGWVVAVVPRIDARVVLTDGPIREGHAVTLHARAVAGTIRSWSWDFGDGTAAEGPEVTHTFRAPRIHEIRLTFTDGKETGSVLEHVRVRFPIEARIAPLPRPVLAGKPAAFSADVSVGKVRRYAWDFGDGSGAEGVRVQHTFKKPGVYRVRLRVADETHLHDCSALVRVHTSRTLHRPQVHLDTDPSNGFDDQHCLAYALLSHADVVAVNSVHHGGGQEPANYAEIERIVTRALHSGSPGLRPPPLFRGANARLAQPESGRWHETEPNDSDAGRALLASARGAAPGRPVWWVAVGAATNVASALLQARRQDLDLTGRVRIVWVGGGKTGIKGQFNGDNDPWAAYVLARSGVETWIIPDHAAEAVTVRAETEAKRYPDDFLGRRLWKALPGGDEPQPLYDPAAMALVISRHAGLSWVKRWERVTVAEDTMEWAPAKGASSVRLVREIDAAAVKRDLFRTLAGKPAPLAGRPPKE